MSDSSTVDPKEPVFQKPKGKKPGPKPKVPMVEFKVIYNPHKEKYRVEFECARCVASCYTEGVIYTKPYCAHCHIEMRRKRD